MPLYNILILRSEERAVTLSSSSNSKHDQGNVWRAVKLLRSKNEMTQEELAQRSGLAIRFLQDVEAGNKQASIKTVFKLADGLGVSPNDLIKEPYKSWQKAGNPE